MEIEDGVAIVTLNRPEVLNAPSEEGSIELHYRIFPDLAQDDRVKAIILTGAGRAFCAGGDQKRGSGDDFIQAQQKRELSLQNRAITMINYILDLDKPIIAAVNGPANGLGATLALFCDMVIAADVAKFGDGHIRVGITAGDGGTVIWPLLVGPAKAKEFLMTGDNIDAKEAERIGLINKVVPLEQLMPTAKQLAGRLAKGPSLALGWTKRSINTKIKQDVNNLLEACAATQRLCYFTEDYKEGRTAFREKRQPQFNGR
ncbi:MAG: enoyl-CoA hydratase/isomerase family protein [Chloroflexi bacterium]|nr:enoyl-CoA hydratase/isomerase family protein [Chloroflexota bacterium]